VGANAIFSLCAAAGALLVASASAAKGRWAVAIVFGMLVVGFLLRAREGRRGPGRAADGPVAPPPRPAQRRVKPARFKRR